MKLIEEKKIVPRSITGSDMSGVVGEKRIF